MPSRTKRYGFTTLTLSEEVAERFRNERDSSEHTTTELVDELLDEYEGAD